MPLFWVFSTTVNGAAHEDLMAARKEHLLWQFENQASDKLLGAGPVFEPDSDGPPVAGMYFLVCADAAEAAAHADTDPFHVKGLREYKVMRWSLNESSFLGVGLKVVLNGNEADDPHYHPPAD